MYWRNIGTYGESYYDHACSIDYEKDVLDIIYNNNSCWTRMKRWWHDLFLLSYYDPRSKFYYRSSHSMRMERLKQYHYYKKNIHPFSKFRNFWDCLILATVVLNKIIFHHSTSVIYGELSWKFYCIGVICEVILLTDLFINMVTGSVNKDDRIINLGLKKSVVNYCSTKLFLHFISSLPLQAIMFLKYGKNINCALCKCNRFVFTLRLVNGLSLYRLYDASEYWKRERHSFRAMAFFKFLRIAVLGVITMMMFANMVDTIYLLAGMCSGVVDPTAYSIIFIRFRYDETSRSIPTRYFLTIEVARILKSFLLYSFSLRPLKHYWDKMTCVLSYVLANTFYMWNLMECFGCLSLMKYSEEKIVINNYRIINLLRWRQLSDKFSLKVMQYCRFNMTELVITEKQNGCYDALPQSLLREITISSYAKYVSRIPFFSEWPQTLIEQITLLLVEEVYMANDIVVEACLSSDGLVIVDVGVLGVYYSSDVGVTYLIDGDCFGEISLVGKENFVTPSVVALTSTKILFLDKTAFRRLMREYSKLFFAMKEEIKKINLLNPDD